MNVKFVNPFLESIKNIFNTMLQVPFEMGKVYLKNDRVPRYEISSIIGLSGTVTGCVVINLSKEIALQLASALSGETVTELDEDCIDAIGEIANMVAGGAKKDFPGDDNCISVPSVVLGKHLICYPSNIPIISIPCETKAGKLIVDIALRENKVPVSTENAMV